MFYRNMPDTYVYKNDGEDYWVFWHEGEFYLHDRNWNKKGLDPSEEFKFFEDVNELLLYMLEIAPYKDWKRYDPVEEWK